MSAFHKVPKLKGAENYNAWEVSIRRIHSYPPRSLYVTTAITRLRQLPPAYEIIDYDAAELMARTGQFRVPIG